MFVHVINVSELPSVSTDLPVASHGNSTPPVLLQGDASLTQFLVTLADNVTTEGLLDHHHATRQLVLTCILQHLVILILQGTRKRTQSRIETRKLHHFKTLK